MGLQNITPVDQLLLPKLIREMKCMALMVPISATAAVTPEGHAMKPEHFTELSWP